MENHKRDDSSNAVDNRQRGWAMLGLILALAVMAIMMTAAAPNIKTEVQREKEAEMVFRGEQMAVAIARYYNNGAPNVGPINLDRPPVYGYLTELKKLLKGVNISTRKIKFIRGSAMIDPMTGIEWEPIRMWDPRIMPALQAYAAHYQINIPQEYLRLAVNPNTQINPDDPDSDVDGDGDGSTGNSNRSGSPAANSNAARDDSDSDSDSDSEDSEDSDDSEDSEDSDDSDDSDDDSEPPPNTNTRTTPVNPVGGVSGVVGRSGQGPTVPLPGGITGSGRSGRSSSSFGSNDPLLALFEKDKDNLPIVGVAPRIKGRAMKALWGLKNYEEWVFIFIPQNFQPQLPDNRNRNRNSSGGPGGGPGNPGGGPRRSP